MQISRRRVVDETIHDFLLCEPRWQLVMFSPCLNYIERRVLWEIRHDLTAWPYVTPSRQLRRIPVCDNSNHKMSITQSCRTASMLLILCAPLSSQSASVEVDPDNLLGVSGRDQEQGLDSHGYPELCEVKVVKSFTLILQSAVIPESALGSGMVSKLRLTSSPGSFQSGKTESTTARGLWSLQVTCSLPLTAWTSN